MNVPLRPPAVMARAAAGLDQLSGGRVELGIGAGGFWDAIEAMGGRRLTPGQGVDALEEAIDIVRELWADGGRVSYDGRYYQLQRAARGPKPAHDIGLWIGAYKPRMLALTGRKGDGWLPSLPYLQPGDLAKGNAAIDAAAREAGRDPGEIRRCSSSRPRRWTRSCGSPARSAWTRSSSWPTTHRRSGPSRWSPRRFARRGAKRSPRRWRGAASWRRAPRRAPARRERGAGRRRGPGGETGRRGAGRGRRGRGAG